MSPFLRACTLVLLMQAAGADAKMSKNMQAKMSKDEQAIKPTTGSSLLLKEVEQMAQSDKSPNMDAIKEIKRIIDEQLLPDLNAEHQASVVETQNKLQAITVCNDQVGQRNQNIATTTEVAVESARQGNSVCRLSEKSMHEHNLTSGSRCGQLGTFLHSLSDPANLPGDRLRAGMVQYVEDLTNTPMCEGPRVRTLDDGCTEAETELATKKSECDLKQATFESDFCTWRTALVLSCDDHTTCYDTALSTYNDHVTQTTALIDNRFRVEFKTMTKIKCYTDVWLNNESTNEVDASAFDHCNAAEPNTDSMNIVFAVAPAKALCSLVEVEHYPGTPGFVTTEYHTFDAFIEQPIACIGPGASAPGASAPVVQATTVQIVRTGISEATIMCSPSTTNPSISPLSGTYYSDKRVVSVTYPGSWHDLAENVLEFSDRRYTLKDVPSELIGWKYFKAALSTEVTCPIPCTIDVSCPGGSIKVYMSQYYSGTSPSGFDGKVSGYIQTTPHWSGIVEGGPRAYDALNGVYTNGQYSGRGVLISFPEGSMLQKSSASPRTAAELDAQGSLVETGSRKTVMRRQKDEESVAFQFNSQGAVDLTTSKPYTMQDLAEMDVNALYGLLKNVGTSTKNIKAGLAKLIMEQQGTA